MGDFRMPSLGADMDEGTLLEWLVKPGDTAHRGDIVAVVDTAKSAVEAECFTDGVVEALVVDPGQVVAVGGVLARLAESAPSAGQPAAATTKGTPPPGQPPAAGPEPEPAERQPGEPALPQTTAAAPSPLVRRRAHELGIDLTTIHGSGEGGVVVRQDIEALAQRAVSRPRVSPLARRLAKTAGVDLTAVAGTGTGGAIRADDIRRATAAGRPKSEGVGNQGPDSRPTSGHAAERVADQRATDMRNSIAALMSRSKREIPHYYLSTTVDLQATSEWIRERNRELPVSERLVPSAALLLAAARAAREVPQLNEHWVDGGFPPGPGCRPRTHPLSAQRWPTGSGPQSC